MSVLALLRLHELSASLKSCSLKTACVHGFGLKYSSRYGQRGLVSKYLDYTIVGCACVHVSEQ